MTCIVCPVGCQLEIELNADGTVKNVTGNSCVRGKKYAVDELTNPVRTLTATVKLSGSESEKRLPVRTDKPIPKGEILNAMKLIKAADVKAPVKTGDIIIKDFIKGGINLIACKNV